MADANYKLTLGPLITTVFQNKIGGKKANPNKLEGEVKNVTVNDGNINIKLQLGGIVGQAWTHHVEVEIGNDTYETIPQNIKGKIPGSGTSNLDKDYKLKKKSAPEA
jgi:hypothetical protein